MEFAEGKLEVWPGMEVYPYQQIANTVCSRIFGNNSHERGKNILGTLAEPQPPSRQGPTSAIYLFFNVYPHFIRIPNRDSFADGQSLKTSIELPT